MRSTWFTTRSTKTSGWIRFWKDCSRPPWLERSGDRPGRDLVGDVAISPAIGARIPASGRHRPSGFVQSQQDQDGDRGRRHLESQPGRSTRECPLESKAEPTLEGLRDQCLAARDMDRAFLSARVSRLPPREVAKLDDGLLLVLAI